MVHCLSTHGFPWVTHGLFTHGSLFVYQWFIVCLRIGFPCKSIDLASTASEIAHAWRYTSPIFRHAQMLTKSWWDSHIIEEITRILRGESQGDRTSGHVLLVGGLEHVLFPIYWEFHNPN